MRKDRWEREREGEIYGKQKPNRNKAKAATRTVLFFKNGVRGFAFLS